jgi:hypothetical protein
MRDGSPPLLPRRYCKHPEGAALPAAEDLEIVWFEEGNGAALLERGEPLTVIPPWAGQGERVRS